jgi:phosphotransferase family enzyme
LAAHDTGLLQATEVARRLVGNTAEVSRLLTGGRNSRIWYVRSGSSAFALKQYPARRDDDLRDRLATETGALRLMEHYQIDTVPRVVAVDSERGFALLSWIDGRDVVDIDEGDIDAAVAFLAAIHRLRATPWAAKQPNASEACLCGTEIVRQINSRLERLMRLSDEPELIDFLDRSLPAAIARASGEARALAAVAGFDFGAELPQEWRSLVPSDFGFHNSIRRSDGSLAFVDFEYFGWDDPVKLAADMLLHPGRTLPVAQRSRFRRLAERLYGEDRSFAQRLHAYLPLFGLRWVLILLNEFVPERWQARALAGGGERWSDIKARQLAHAKKFLESLSERVKN